MSSSERARHWRPAELPGLDLLRARYVAKTFSPHTHDAFVIAAVSRGVEEFRHRGTLERAGAGTVSMINPDTPHTGRAGIPEGWTYHVLYPRPELVARIAADTTTIRGTPSFSATVVIDPRGVRLVTDLHRTAENDDMLATDILLRQTVTYLLTRYGSAEPAPAPPGAGARAAARAREILLARMAAPPALGALAAELDTGPYALLRAFRDAYGLPPHTWLTDARVRRARDLLDHGTSPADAACHAGFTDQPHLNRHFTRIVGVPPGAYQRERRNR
ncbi:AraC family transcriptional regulator [Streptantibioticus silvisoli]|uniref:AraC family transcriptional regulator n=1 Tax=Streptantibioticus silvisoli TaxID=2705255 RepID=A0ABT6W8D7_9ACTN|nr:AraC family transcriptional regulator [Streptantibioticus silvisoli]MDI5967017.1 AraC family transcriptional regulator [Streptantibioticus silvisoli]